MRLPFVNHSVCRLSLLALIFCFLLVPSVQSATLTVCGSGCNSTTIQGAIDLASSGDTVEVGAGTYNENIIVNKTNLTLVSDEFVTTGNTTANTTLINGGGIDKLPVTIEADEATFQGFTVFNYRWGVYVDDVNATIDNCIIYDTGVHYVETPRDYEGNRGIYAYLTQASSSSVTITNNLVYDNWRGDAGTNSSRMNMAGRGIYVGSDVFGVNNSALIDNNEVYGSDQAGIYVRKVTATVTNNYVHDNGFDGLDEMQWCTGIMLGYSEGTNLIENNTIERIKAPWTQYGSISSGGIIFYGVTWSEDPHYGIVRINNNTVDTGSASAGINVHNPSDADWDVYITNNTVSGTTADPRAMLPTWGGIHVWNAKRVQSILNPSLYADIYTCDEYFSHVDAIEGNTVTGHEIGIVIDNATVDSLHFNNVDNIGYDINVTLEEVGVDATDNWWGSTTPNASKFLGNVTYFPFCLNDECSEGIDDETTEFTGDDTTNFSAITNWSSVDLCLDDSHGMINWTDSLSLVGSCMEFDEYVGISHNRISVDTSAMPELAQPAVLTFRSTGFTAVNDFLVFRNGALCPSTICTSYSVGLGGVVELAVTQMSDYSLVESGIYRTLSDAGSGLGGFLTAIQSPVVGIVLALGIIGGILAIFYAIASVIRRAVGGATAHIGA